MRKIKPSQQEAFQEEPQQIENMEQNMETKIEDKTTNYYERDEYTVKCTV